MPDSGELPASTGRMNFRARAALAISEKSSMSVNSPAFAMRIQKAWNDRPFISTPYLPKG